MNVECFHEYEYDLAICWKVNKNMSMEPVVFMNMKYEYALSRRKKVNIYEYEYIHIHEYTPIGTHVWYVERQESVPGEHRGWCISANGIEDKKITCFCLQFVT